ncbi:MAG: DUF3048 C-terminal domain-containing protein [Anaerolineales bacterium]
MKFSAGQVRKSTSGGLHAARVYVLRLAFFVLWSGFVFIVGCSKPTPSTLTMTPLAISATSISYLPRLTYTATLPSQTIITSSPTSTTELESVGPDIFPSDVNPLTGLKVENPTLLELPPALVSISNSPRTARPQSGLSYASFVFELYIGEGASRFLAVFYGDYPPVTMQTPDGEEYPVEIGPIRSGRLPYESLRLLYKGFLVFASASNRVLPYLDEYYLVFGDTDADNVNTAHIAVSDLIRLAQNWKPSLGQPHLYGLRFDAQTPPGGEKGNGLWIPFHYTDQVFWRYDPQLRAYLRSQDEEDGSTIVPHVDRLTGRTLAFENVVVMFANYTFFDATLFKIDLMYITRSPALLFRDGRMYEIYWTTGNTEYERKTGRLRPIRFVDREGNPIPLHPGQTWVEIIPLYTTYREVIDTTDYKKLLSQAQPGSGIWAVYFYPPVTQTEAAR